MYHETSKCWQAIDGLYKFLRLPHYLVQDNEKAVVRKLAMIITVPWAFVMMWVIVIPLVLLLAGAEIEEA